jgi:quinol monooxygenase YgiN
MPETGPILRVFEVRCKPGCRDRLLENFATTSADVVRNEPGNRGYFFGRCIQGGEDTVLFVSVWEDLESVQSRFSEGWQESHLPEGYEDLIETCSIRHFDTGPGWHVDELLQGNA